MTSAEWHEGGTISWELGGASPIKSFEPGEEVVIAGSWMDTTFEFQSTGRGTTLVVLSESSPGGGASFTDGKLGVRLQVSPL